MSENDDSLAANFYKAMERVLWHAAVMELEDIGSGIAADMLRNRENFYKRKWTDDMQIVNLPEGVIGKNPALAVAEHVQELRARPGFDEIVSTYGARVLEGMMLDWAGAIMAKQMPKTPKETPQSRGLERQLYPARLAAAVALAERGLGVPAFLTAGKALNRRDPDEIILVAAIHALGERRNAEVVDALIEMLPKSERTIGLAAVIALGKIDYSHDAAAREKAVAALSNELGSRNEEAAIASIEGLGKLGGAKAAEALVEHIEYVTKTTKIKKALRQLGDDVALPALIGGLERGPNIGNYCEEIIKEMGEHAISAVVAAFGNVGYWHAHDYQQLERVAESLARLGSSDAAINAIARVMQAEPWRREDCMKLMGHVIDWTEKWGKGKTGGISAPDIGTLDLQSAIRQMKRRPVAVQKAVQPVVQKLPQAGAMA